MKVLARKPKKVSKGQQRRISTSKKVAKKAKKAVRKIKRSLKIGPRAPNTGPRKFRW